MNPHRVQAAIAVLAVAGLSALTACSSPAERAATAGVSGSRVELYDSLAALAADASSVVTAEVLRQEPGLLDAPDPELRTPLTISTVRVLRTAHPDGLATEVASGVLDVAAGDELRVRQIGTSEMTETPAPIMSTGQTYLLFLTPTALPGAAADEFYVTGASAGLFAPATSSRSSEPTFTSVSQDGDSLPADVALSTLGS